MTYSILDRDTNRILITGRRSKTKKGAIKALADFMFQAGDIENPKDFNEDDIDFFNYEIIKDEKNL